MPASLAVPRTFNGPRGVGAGRGHRPEPVRPGVRMSREPQPPVACSLTSADARSRQAEWRRLLRGAALTRNALPGGMRIELHSDESVRSELARLVQLERVCCPFLDFAIEESDGKLILTVAAPPEAEPLVQDLLS